MSSETPKSFADWKATNRCGPDLVGCCTDKGLCEADLKGCCEFVQEQ